MDNNSLHIISHPILQHQLAYLRNKNTSSSDFRRVLSEMSKLIAYEAMRNFPSKKMKIETPMGMSTVASIVHCPIVISIMRAGNEMLNGVLELLPEASAGHIGIYRDRFVHNTVEYYFRLPPHVKNKPIILLDPLLATGDTILAELQA